MECYIDGLKLYYEDQGSGEPILFLHGWGANGQSFNCVTELLKDSYRIIKLDFPGFGKSDMVPEAWNADQYADITDKFIRHLGLAEINLVGHSHGGRTIIKLNAHHPEFRIKKIVLIDSAGILPPKSLKKTVRIRVFKIGKAILNLPPIKKWFPDALDHYRSHFGSTDYKNAAGVLRESMVKLVNEDMTPYLKEIKCPTVLIWGDQDDATPMRDAKIMEKEIPDAGLVVIENAGHFSFLKNPYLVAEVMKSFIH